MSRYLDQDIEQCEQSLEIERAIRDRDETRRIQDEQGRQKQQDAKSKR